MNSFIFGVDLGKVGDYTALVVTEVTGDGFTVRHIERLKKGTKYPEQVAHIKRLREKLETLGESYLVIDQTGVGQAVVDMLEDEGVEIDAAVSITGGKNEHQNGNQFSVPKRNVISVVQVMLQNKQLRIGSNLPLADELIKELLAFKESINQRGHDSYGNDATKAPHDDLVIATALGAWYCNKLNTPFFMT